MGMDRQDRVILTNMCMVTDGTKVLVENKVTKNGKGITFPGGHIEEKEPIVDSVIREIYEETGLTISSPKLCGVKEWLNEDGSRYIVFLFRANQYSGELKSSEEGEVFWAELAELPSLPTMWHMEALLEVYAGEKYSEVFLDPDQDWKPVLK